MEARSLRYGRILHSCQGKQTPPPSSWPHSPCTSGKRFDSRPLQVREVAQGCPVTRYLRRNVCPKHAVFDCTWIIWYLTTKGDPIRSWESWWHHSWVHRRTHKPFHHYKVTVHGRDTHHFLLANFLCQYANHIRLTPWLHGQKCFLANFLSFLTKTFSNSVHVAHSFSRVNPHCLFYLGLFRGETMNRIIIVIN